MLDKTTIDIISNVSASVLIFIVWFIYHKAQTAIWVKTNDQNFKILSAMIETNLANTGLLTKIYEKVITNQWCPIVKTILQEEGGNN